jgi:hypothetical protein
MNDLVTVQTPWLSFIGNFTPVDVVQLVGHDPIAMSTYPLRQPTLSPVAVVTNEAIAPAQDRSRVNFPTCALGKEPRRQAID